MMDTWTCFFGIDVFLQRTSAWEETWILVTFFMKETWEKVNRYRRRGHVEEGAHGCVESEGHAVGEEFLRRG
jgi:hypothetical protein